VEYPAPGSPRNTPVLREVLQEFEGWPEIKDVHHGKNGRLLQFSLGCSQVGPLASPQPRKSAGNLGVRNQLYHFAKLTEHPRKPKNWGKGRGK